MPETNLPRKYRFNPVLFQSELKSFSELFQAQYSFPHLLIGPKFGPGSRLIIQRSAYINGYGC